MEQTPALKEMTYFFFGRHNLYVFRRLCRSVQGPQRKKNKYASLKSFLLDIHKLPMVKQKLKLEKEFNEWKGENTQIDDVLILGLRI